ncbi:MAG TPA: hypothetical protein VI565_01860, partial [Burkholderiales bacterium]|nr:hypothetical protein [Burkholderiales bacterium]
MLDLKLIREKTADVRANLARRMNPEVSTRLDELLTVDKQWREANVRVDAVRAERNRLAQEIGSAKAAGKPASEVALSRSKELPAALQAAQTEVDALRLELDRLAMRLPNLLHESVPFGKDDSENQVVRSWGTPRKIDNVQSHADLAEKSGLAEFARATKVSGAGFVYLKGDLARLDLALQRFAIDYLETKGFVP